MVNSVPGLEDADPNEDIPAGKLPAMPAMSQADHAKLDKYRICGRCQVGTTLLFACWRRHAFCFCFVRRFVWEGRAANEAT